MQKCIYVEVKMGCRIEGCGGKIFSSALCSKHYNRLRTTGTTDDGPRARKPFAQRLWEKIDKRGENDCWPWVGNTVSLGYGQLSLYGRPSTPIRSHRAVWEQVNGPIPEGMVVRHTCHNRACCNPGHLVLGTRYQNVQDMWERESGAPKGFASLTDDDVIEIRESKLSRQELAAKYNVTPKHIYAIRVRRCWKNLP
jgi:hypothetical protein